MEAKTLAARAREIHTNPYINVALKFILEYAHHKGIIADDMRKKS